MTYTFRDPKNGEELCCANLGVKPTPNIVGDFGSRVTGGDTLLCPVLHHLLHQYGEDISTWHVRTLRVGELVIPHLWVVGGVDLMQVIPWPCKADPGPEARCCHCGFLALNDSSIRGFDSLFDLISISFRSPSCSNWVPFLNYFGLLLKWALC